MDFLSNINAARILIAEADPDVMDQTADALEEAGYSIHKAYYAGDAVYAMRHNQFDLVLVDIWMKDRDQQHLTDQLVEFGSLRWIAVVDEQEVNPQRLLRQGAAAYIQRPLKPDILLRHVDNVLQGRTMRSTDSLSPSSLDTDDTNAGSLSEMLQRRLIEQQTLSKLARSLSAVLDLDILLTEVVDAAVYLSNAEEGLLLLPDDEGRALHVRAVKGIDSETARNFRIKTQDTLAGQVFHSGQPILVGDQGLQKIKTEYLVKSLLYVPLSIKGQTIGVLGVNNKHADRTFNQHDLGLLQDLAAHAAVAIENARLYEDSLLRTRELSTLVRAGEAANSTLAIDQVLSIIAGQLVNALNVAQCYIGEWEPGQRLAHLLAVRYRAVWRSGDGPVLSVKNNPSVEQAFTKRRAVVTAPTMPPDDPLQATWLPHRYNAHTVITIPLLADKQPLGVVMLYQLHAPYSGQSALGSAQLELHQLAMDMVVKLAGLDTEYHHTGLFEIAQQMLDTTQTNWCEVALWDMVHRQFNITLSYGEAIWRADPGPGFDLEHFPQLARLLDQQTTITGLPHDDLQSLADTGQSKSMLGLPLVIKGGTAGLVMLFDTLHNRRFTRREVELAQALVLQAANALGNARLYRDLELSLEELHRTQSKLIQTARLSAMGELAAAVAHQINNPLTTILGDTEMILDDLSSDNPHVEGLEAILRAGKRAHEVVRRLLTMARQQSSDDQLELINVNESIRNTLTLVRGHIQQGRVALSVDLDDEMPLVAGVQGQLEDVWLNLLLNARDAVVNRNQPEIGITSRYDAAHDQVEITVWDNGVGIDSALQDQIFEPFFTTKPAGEGTGLGLHICQQIIEKFSGSISLQSIYNEGTRFLIHLPTYYERENL